MVVCLVLGLESITCLYIEDSLLERFVKRDNVETRFGTDVDDNKLTFATNLLAARGEVVFGLLGKCFLESSVSIFSLFRSKILYLHMYMILY